jgi:DNA-binding CsgD family transcriptional regulator
MNNDRALALGIQSATNVADIGIACHGVAQALGFEHFIYGFRVPYPLAEPCQFILSGYPLAWMRRYDEQRYLAIDPVLRHGLASVVPFTWDELDRSDARVAQLFREAAEHGLCHGVSVAVHGARGEGGLLSLARTRPVSSAPVQRHRLFQRLQWLAALVHQRMRHVVFTDSDPPQLRPLSPRERECLLLAAEGHSANDIGKDMKIAERTVVFHLNRAEQKLGARRRQEAVARAVALGAIEPQLYPDRFVASKKLVQVPK